MPGQQKIQIKIFLIKNRRKIRAMKKTKSRMIQQKNNSLQKKTKNKSKQSRNSQRKKKGKFWKKKMQAATLIPACQW